MNATDIKYNQNNEIVKYKFFEELEHSKDGKDPKTVNQFINAVHEFEVATGFKDFKKYTGDWAIIYKDHLNDKKNKQTGDNISKSYYLHYISNVRRFFEWLVENEKGYSKIKRKHIDYLHVGKNDKNKAKATNYAESHDIADVLATIRNMPEATEMEMRNKAMLSLFLLTTPRVGSIQTATISSIKYFKDYKTWAFIQDPRVQNTKFSKKITAFFIGQCDDIILNVINWQKHLIAKGFKAKDGLFPKITPSFNKQGDSITLLTKECMKSDSKIRDIVKEAFEANNLPYIKPHNFRHSVTRHIRKTHQNPTDALIAFAENAGQKNGYSTLITSYAGDPLESSAELMKAILLE